MSTTDDTNAARRWSGSNDLLGLLARLQSLKVLLGTDSPEVRGWAPVVQQGAQATVNAAIAALKKCGGDNCMGRRCDDVTNWVTEQAAQARVAAERERWQKWACRKEWDTVNDPPCHPGDKDWRPCANCAGPNTEAEPARPAERKR